MAIPILAAGVAHTIGGAISDIALGPLHAALSGLWTGLDRSSKYTGNENDPNLIPAMEQIFAAHLRKDINWAEFTKLLASHGVSFAKGTVNGEYTRSDKAWDSYRKSLYTRPDLVMLLTLASRGFFNKAGSEDIDTDRFKELAKYTLSRPSDWKEFQESLKYTLHETQLMELFNRQWIDSEDMYKRLSAVGIISSEEQDGIRHLARVIPPPQELAVMARRFAFAEQSTIDALGLDKEYPAEFAYWAERQGYGTVDGFTDGKADGKSVDFAKNQWRIHWNTIAPALAYQFFQRLRANRDHFGEDAQFAGLSFPFDSPDPGKLTLSLALRDAGYTEPFRPLLAAISYRLFGFRQIGQIQYFNPAINGQQDKGKEWVTQRLQDNGYQRETAALYADTLIRTNAQKKAQQQLDLTRAKIEESWSIGVITADSAVSLLQTIGWTAEEANNAVSAWELARQTQLAKRLIAGIRRNFLLGDLSTDQAINQLATIGIENSRIGEYINLWSVEQRQYRLERGVATLTKWLGLGTITEQQMADRLVRIGWADEDVQRIIQSAIIANMGKLKPQQKARKGKMGRIHLGVFKELNDSQIRELLQQGLITHDRALDGLIANGYDAEDALLLIQMWAGDQKLVGPS